MGSTAPTDTHTHTEIKNTKPLPQRNNATSRRKKTQHNNHKQHNHTHTTHPVFLDIFTGHDLGWLGCRAWVTAADADADATTSTTELRRPGLAQQSHPEQHANVEGTVAVPVHLALELAIRSVALKHLVSASLPRLEAGQAVHVRGAWVAHLVVAAGTVHRSSELVNQHDWKEPGQVPHQRGGRGPLQQRSNQESWGSRTTQIKGGHTQNDKISNMERCTTQSEGGRQTDRQTVRRTGRRTSRQTNRQINRQTNKHIERLKATPACRATSTWPLPWLSPRACQSRCAGGSARSGARQHDLHRAPALTPLEAESSAGPRVTVRMIPTRGGSDD